MGEQVIKYSVADIIWNDFKFVNTAITSMQSPNNHAQSFSRPKNIFITYWHIYLNKFLTNQNNVENERSGEKRCFHVSSPNGLLIAKSEIYGEKIKLFQTHINKKVTINMRNKREVEESFRFSRKSSSFLLEASAAWKFRRLEHILNLWNILENGTIWNNGGMFKNVK